MSTGDPTGGRRDPGAARAILGADTVEAARHLLGALLVRDERIVRIVEVEAYIGPEDLASHARFGRTLRNAVMFGPPGVAYVYLVYGMYHCLNVVTGTDATAAAVLIRAAEPVAGVDAMRAGRSAQRSVRGRLRGASEHAAEVPSSRLASGPGVLCAALSIDRDLSGTDLLGPASPLRLELPTEPLPDDRIGTSARVGIAYAAEPWRSRPWRFFDRASASVSGPVAARRG